MDGVSFSIEPGRTLGIVGESGCGKSVANLTILGLTRAPNARISGRISFEGRDLLELDEEGLREVRGNEIAMIFQDPLSSLHPLYRVGDQLVEAIQAHRDVPDSARPASAPSSSWARSGSRTPSGASRTTRTSSRAGCASAR